MSVTDHIRRELLGEFRQSARDRLERIAAAWMAIEADAAAAGAHAPLLLRELHTLKGEAKLMGFGEVCALAHRAEDVVMAARGRGFAELDGIGPLLLRAFDRLGHMVEGDADGPGDAALDGELAAATASVVAKPGPIVPPAATGPPAPVAAPVAAQSPPPPPPLPEMAPPTPAPERDSWVRIDVATAHLLAEGAGEQLIAHQRYLRIAAELRAICEPLGDARLDELLDRLGDELHRGDAVARALELDARRLRLVPLGPRLRIHLRAVRDLAHELGKKAVVRVHDGGIAVDRDVVERLGDPLLHLLRNAVDHGLEQVAARTAAGKPEVGRITITAERTGGDVVLIVEDDGAGVEPDHIRRRAGELGLLGESVVDDDAALALLFAPGFSTRKRVTETSGRGVGLDVVKRQIEALGGTVRVSSRPGHGTRFELRIPVSVALTRALAVEEHGQTFVFPHAAVEAVVSAAAGDIALVHTRRTIDLRDGRIPVVDLSAVLRLPAPATVTDALHAVILRHEGQRVAVLVERWRGDTEVVVKPLGALAPSRLAIGACTLDGGELAVVLSPAEVIARALGEVPRVRAAAKTPDTAAAARRVLVVEDSAITRTMIGRLLRMLGYQVAEAADGNHALRVLDEAPADLVITDLEMPELDGIELLHRLRADGRWRTTPVIVLTTRGSEQDKRRAVAAGADAYLVKTEFSEAALRDALARHLRLS
jgi:two-component system, chemotaxis family, sensor kinase CheA